MAGAWLHTHPRQARSAYLSKVAARMYLPFGENFTKDTGGLSSSAWSTDVAAAGLPHHRPVESPPHVPTLPPPTTCAGVRATPPVTPGQESFGNKGPAASWPQEAGPSAPRGRVPSGHREGRGGPSRGWRGSPTPSYPEDAAAPLNRGSRSPEGYSGSVQVLPGNHLAISPPHP